MSKKINLDEFVDEMPFACSQYRTKIKNEMLEFGKQLLELAAENVKLEYTTSSLVGPPTTLDKPRVNKQSITNTIKQIQ
jgi:hypothetical protein